MKAWFVSDIHIKSASDSNCRLFEEFLNDRLSDSTTHLFLVGDVFDLWVGRHLHFSRRYAGVVEKVAKLVERGIAVHYFEGNHDLHLQRFWSDQTGVHVHTGPAYFDIDGLRVRVEHGDQMNPKDRGYLFLRWLLRTPPLAWLARVLPGESIQMIGDRMSRASRGWTSSTFKRAREEAIREMMVRHARLMAEKSPFDLLVAGHVHVRVDEELEIAGRKTRLINLGWWGEGEKRQVFSLISGKPDWSEIRPQ